MEHSRYRPARVYAVESAPLGGAADSLVQANTIECLEDALAQLGAQVYIVDRELRIIRLSPAAAGDTAPPIGRLAPGQSILSAVAPEQRAALQSACQDVLHGRRARFSCTLATSDEARQLHLAITPARGRDGTIVGVTLTGRSSTTPAPEATTQRTALLRLLNHTGARLASELDQDAIVHIVTEALVAQLGLAFARIWLFEPSSATLVLRSSAGLYTEIGGEFERIRLGQHAVGKIATTRQPLITNDVPNTPGLGGHDWAIATGMRGFAGYPLLARGRLMGVIAFFSYSALDADLIAALEPLAHQVALALERAQLSLAQVAARDEARALASVATSRAAQLSATLAAMADGVWTCDQHGRLLTVNTAALEMFGLDPAEVRLETLADIVALFAAASAEPELCLGLPAALEGRTLRRELVLGTAQAGGGPLSVMVTATPMRDADGQVIGAVAVVRNITQQKLMEQLKDDFLSVAAHELKTPVTAIKGYAQLALMRLRTSGDTRTLQRALQTIEEQSQRIAHLVDELVDVSRIQGGKLELRHELIDLVALARRAVERAQAQAAQHRLLLEAPPSLAVVADGPRIEQVLHNLLENAIKYSPESGTIQVEIRAHDGMACVTVVDHGIGIAREKQAHVFDAWFQAHGDTVGDFGGMGLGLSICKEIVERHGGSIWVQSMQDHGSRFSFTVPLATPESDA